jgi:recombinational DNA repair protein RecR
MTQCVDCRTFKKGDNCIRCYRETRQRYDELIMDLNTILNGTSYYQVGDKIRARLKRETE